jgi:hypothetical protein
MTKAIAVALVLAACAESPQQPSRSPDADELIITGTDTGITGSYGTTTFSSELPSPTVLDMKVTVNGMVITALVDFNSGVIEYDGYTAATGDTTQMTDDDRAALVDLEAAFAQLEGDQPVAVTKLRGFVATWAEHPTTVPLQDMRLVEENRSWTSLCYAKNSYYPGSHDCDSGGFWTDQTTLDNVWLSSTGDLGGPDGVAWYFPGGGSYQCCSGSWSCSRYSCSVPSAGWYVGVEVDHDTRVEYSYGNCFGVCGAGCPGTYQYTVDCLNHDTCTRNGHVLASGYCDDQFSAASDDWASAPDCGA